MVGTVRRQSCQPIFRWAQGLRRTVLARRPRFKPFAQPLSRPISSKSTLGGVHAMKYIANPVEVEAFKIVTVGPLTMQGSRRLELQNGELVSADSGMLARMSPVVGDYWVIQEDG